MNENLKVGKEKKEKAINFCFCSKQSAFSSAFINVKQLPNVSSMTSHLQKENAKETLISLATLLHS